MIQKRADTSVFNSDYEFVELDLDSNASSTHY